jgi:hypothetical protein
MSVTKRFFAPTKLLDGLRNAIGISNNKNFDAIKTLESSLKDVHKSEKPLFIFVHNLLPHEPLNKDCTISEEQLTPISYGNAAACVNQSVLRVAREIAEQDPTAIVVFQADHGSGFAVNFSARLKDWSDKAIDERSGILNLIHMPESCKKYIRSDLSPINTMRLVVACIEQTPPNYVRDTTYLVTYETSPDFGIAKVVQPNH